jgi:hypothetical protein
MIKGTFVSPSAGVSVRLPRQLVTMVGKGRYTEFFAYLPGRPAFTRFDVMNNMGDVGVNPSIFAPDLYAKSLLAIARDASATLKIDFGSSPLAYDRCERTTLGDLPAIRYSYTSREAEAGVVLTYDEVNNNLYTFYEWLPVGDGKTRETFEAVRKSFVHQPRLPKPNDEPRPPLAAPIKPPSCSEPKDN